MASLPASLAASLPASRAGRAARSRRAWLLPLLGLPVLALLGALLLAASPAGNRWLLLHGLRAGSLLLPDARLDIADLRTDVLRTLVLRGVRLADRDGHTLVSLESFEVRWSPEDLLRGRLHLEEVVLRRPQVDLGIDEQGRLDLLLALGLGGDPDEAPTPWRGSPLKVRVDRLRVLEGEARLRRTLPGGGSDEWSAEGLDLALGLDLAGRAVALERVVAIGDLAHGAGSPALAVGLGGTAALGDEGDEGGPQALVLDDLRLGVGKARVGLAGTIRGLGGAPAVDLRLALADADPATLAPLFGDPGLRGPFALEATAQGAVCDLTLSGAVRPPPGAGAVRFAAWADLSATPYAWRADLAFEALEPHRFVPALPEPFHIGGTLRAEGSGLSWPTGLAAEAGLALEPGVAWGVPFDGLSAAITARDGRIGVRELAFTSALGRGRATGTADLAPPTLDLAFAVQGLPLPELARLGVEGATGRADARGTLRVGAAERGVDLAVAGDVDLSAVAWSDQARAARLTGPVRLTWGPVGLVVSGTAQASGLEARGATAQGLYGPWRVEAPRGGPLHLQAEPTLDHVGLGPLRIGRARLAMRADLAADSPPALEVGFYAAEVSAPDAGLPDLAADRAAGRLTLAGQALQAQVDARRQDLGVLAADLTLDLDSGRLTLPALTVAPWPGLSWSAVEPVEVTLTEDGPRGLRAHLAAGEAEIWAQGDLAGSWDLRLMGSALPLASLAGLHPALPRGVDGTARLAFLVQGAPDDLTVDGGLEVAGLVVPGTLRDVSGRLAIHGAGDRLAFQLSTAEGGGPDPETAGAAASPPLAWLEGEVPVVLDAAGLALDPTAPWALDLLLSPGEIARLGEVLELPDLPDGRASGHLRVGGTPAAATVQGGLALEVRVGEEGQFVRLDLDLSEADGRAQAVASLSRHLHRQAELRATAATGLPSIVAGWAGAAGAAPEVDQVGSWVSDIDATLVPLGISADVLRCVVDLPESLDGALVGALNARGDPLRPELTGALQLADARLGDLAVSPALLSLQPSGDGYRMDLDLGFEEGGLAVGGQVPARLDLAGIEAATRLLDQPGLDLAVRGPGLPVAALAALAGEQEGAEGLVRIEGRVGGSLANPEPALALDLRDGRIVSRNLGVAFDDIVLRGRLDGSRLELAEVSAWSRPADARQGARSARDAPPAEEGPGKGSLRLEGDATLAGWSLGDLSLTGEADHFWLADRPRERLQLSGRLSARGRWPALRVRGAATLDEAGFVADDSFWLYSGTLTLDPRLAVHRGDAAAVVAAPALPPWHRDLDIGLELDLSRSTSVQVEMPLDDAYGALEASLASILLDARLDGRLEASYRSGALGLTGEVQPVWGRADILGARFSLSEGGTIVFLGDDPFDPALQLAAVHDAGRWGEVGVDIGGTLGDMTLAFHSDDYPDETDIVSILLLGSPASELSSAQSQSNAGLMSAASSVLFGEIERRGASGRLLDMIELGGGVYKAGRAIGDDLFVTLAVNPEAQGEEGENVTEVKVDWTISRAWSAEFVTGDQGSGSADIFWSLRF